MSFCLCFCNLSFRPLYHLNHQQHLKFLKFRYDLHRIKYCHLKNIVCILTNVTATAGKMQNVFMHLPSPSCLLLLHVPYSPLASPGRNWSGSLHCGLSLFILVFHICRIVDYILLSGFFCSVWVWNCFFLLLDTVKLYRMEYTIICLTIHLLIDNLTCF